MDPVTIEKLKAMKRYKRCGFLHRIISFLVSLVSLGLLLSCPLWLPKLYSISKYTFHVCFPRAREIVMQPKCLFIVCNLIVVLLLCDSKARDGAKEDIYEEYAKRNGNVGRKEEMKGDGGCSSDEEDHSYVEEIAEGCHVDEDDDGDDDGGIPAEELNKRVEDFIARFNRQRMLEDTMFI